SPRLPGSSPTRRSSDLACILNVLKKFGKLDEDLLLISPHIIEPVSELKTKGLGGSETSLSVNEMLIALSISATTNPLTHMAIERSEEHTSELQSRFDTV